MIWLGSRLLLLLRGCVSVWFESVTLHYTLAMRLVLRLLVFVLTPACCRAGFSISVQQHIKSRHTHTEETRAVKMSKYDMYTTERVLL